MTEARRRLRPLVLVAAAAVLGLGFDGPVRAEDDQPIPGSCDVHPTHVVNPGCVPALTSELREPGITLPNVSPDVRNVTVAPQTDFLTGQPFPGPVRLRFDSWVMNLGTVPVELTPDDPLQPTTVQQCVSWTGHVCREERVVGGFVWHDEHKHVHFADFADYQLRRLGPDGRPDYSSAGLISRSEKVSFCLLDAQLVDPDKWSPPFYTTCGQFLQGISPGWADVYGIGTPGQELSIDGVTDGRYALVVTMDHANRLYETDDTDNVVEVTLEISGAVTQVAIVGRHRPPGGSLQ